MFKQSITHFLERKKNRPIKPKVKVVVVLMMLLHNWQLLTVDIVGQLQSRCKLLLSIVWNKDHRHRQYTANSFATVSNHSQPAVIDFLLA